MLADLLSSFIELQNVNAWRQCGHFPVSIPMPPGASAFVRIETY